ncbi:uncharacterized protein RSE6_08427 [Rhynchosporium secalis]|uniref:Uncharacterized protein n=1 Tax=Rhynchosporium secalis TaxID=38038 RepID=A0A1E1MFE0_RHYSE|nr:uncharacterized protein RSE6_08427 [Rhynchosporium secalis]
MSNVIYFNITYDDDTATYRVEEVSSGNKANVSSATDLSQNRNTWPPSSYDRDDDAKTDETTFQNIKFLYRLARSTLRIVVFIIYGDSNAQIGPFYGDLKDGVKVDYEGKDSAQFYLKNGNELWINAGGKNAKAMSF